MILVGHPYLVPSFFIMLTLGKMRMFFHATKHRFLVDCWRIQCHIDGLWDPACHAEGRVVTHSRSGDQVVGKARRANEVPLPDGHYTLLRGPCRSLKGSDTLECYYCAVGNMSAEGRFIKVTIVDLIADDYFYSGTTFDRNIQLA